MFVFFIKLEVIKLKIMFFLFIGIVLIFNIEYIFSEYLWSEVDFNFCFKNEEIDKMFK